jgi:hypothetical protein
MECNGCTLCCKLLDIPWMNSPVGKYCSKCMVGGGCLIYDNAPEECKKYQCAYSQMENATIDLRPDKCHVIFERFNDHIFIGLIEQGYSVNNIVKNQINIFNNDGYSVFLKVVGSGSPLIMASKDKKAIDIYEEVMTTVTKKDGSCIIYN